MKDWFKGIVAAVMPQKARVQDRALPEERLEPQPHDDPRILADCAVATAALDLMERRDVAALWAMLPELEAAGNNAPDKPALPERRGDTLVMFGTTPDDMRLAAAAMETPGIREFILYDPMPYATLHFLIGWLYYEYGEVERASLWFARGLKNDPWDTALVVEYANVLSRMGRCDESLAMVDRFLAEVWTLHDRERAALQRRRGYALGDMGRHDEAIAAFKVALKIEPGNEVCTSEIAWNKEEKKRKG